MATRIFTLFLGTCILLLAIVGKGGAQYIFQAEHHGEQVRFQHEDSRSGGGDGGGDDDDDPFKPPKEIYHDAHTASKVARRLVKDNTVAMINTKFQEGNDTLAMSFPEYAIDCLDSGDPILLFIKMSHNWRNVAAHDGYDSSITYTVDSKDIYSDWPGASTGSMYGMPRVNLRGHFRLLQVEEAGNKTASVEQPFDVRYISKEESRRIEKCFLSRHRETGSWFPGDHNHVHSSLWTEFVVDNGYFVGGFGGYAYIGGLAGDVYHSIHASRPASQPQWS